MNNINSKSILKKTLLLFAIGLTLAASKCSDDNGDVAKNEIIRPAKLLILTEATNVRSVSLPAVIEASESAVLTFQVGGLVQEILVQDGQNVTKGTVIAKIDARDLENNLATAKSQADEALQEFERAENLIKKGTISQSAYDQRKTQSEVASANQRIAQKAVDDTVLYAPFEGVVAEVHAKQFQNITTQEPVVTFQSSGPLEAVIQVPAQVVANSNNVDPQGTVIILDAAPDLEIPAEFLTISTLADSATQTYELHFKFDPPSNVVVLPGMTGEIKSSLVDKNSDQNKSNVQVPLSAIMSEGDSQFVWVVDETNMTVFRQDIKYKKGIGENLIITEGLSIGDVIVGAGASYLHEGIKISRYEQ